MGKNSRTLTFLLPVTAVLLGFVLYDYGCLVLRDEMRAVEEVKEAKTKTLEKTVEAVARRPSLERSLQALKERRRAGEASMVEGATPSVAAANLQNILKTMIAERGGIVASERVEKPEDLGRFKVVRVSVETLLPETRALSDILLLMEGQAAALLVRELDVRIRNHRAPRELTARFKVSALSAGK